ncbi:MAG: hypothetical protein H7833_06310 [Magnetococcus sp. DMHC-1]
MKCYRTKRVLSSSALLAFFATALSVPNQASAIESHNVDYSFCDGKGTATITNPKIGQSYTMCYSVTNLEKNDVQVDMVFKAVTPDSGASRFGFNCGGGKTQDKIIGKWQENGQDRIQFILGPGKTVKKDFIVSVMSLENPGVYEQSLSGYAVGGVCVKAITYPATASTKPGSIAIELAHANTVVAIDNSRSPSPAPVAPPPPPAKPTLIDQIVEQPSKITVKSGASFKLSWRVKNVGTATWSTDGKSDRYEVGGVQRYNVLALCSPLRRDGSNRTSPRRVLITGSNKVVPGQTVSVDWMLDAKLDTDKALATPGDYSGTCQLYDGSNSFGQAANIKFKVIK